MYYEQVRQFLLGNRPNQPLPQHAERVLGASPETLRDLDRHQMAIFAFRRFHRDALQGVSHADLLTTMRDRMDPSVAEVIRLVPDLYNRLVQANTWAEDVQCGRLTVLNIVYPKTHKDTLTERLERDTGGFTDLEHLRVVADISPNGNPGDREIALPESRLARICVFHGERLATGGTKLNRIVPASEILGQSQPNSGMPISDAWPHNMRRQLRSEGVPLSAGGGNSASHDFLVPDGMTAYATFLLVINAICTTLGATREMLLINQTLLTSLETASTLGELVKPPDHLRLKGADK